MVLSKGKNSTSSVECKFSLYMSYGLILVLNDLRLSSVSDSYCCIHIYQITRRHILSAGNPGVYISENLTAYKQIPAERR
jgi:hypothetical protein